MTNATSVELSAGKLHYLDSGRGRPLVFLHGLVLNAEFWRKVAGPVSGHFRCVVPTLRLGGHANAMRADGTSPPPDWPTCCSRPGSKSSPTPVPTCPRTNPRSWSS
jgi:pimeloyl-ACP methyl ester carboxylesterase